MLTDFTIEHATPDDLFRIVTIYNSVIASRMVTADTEEITVESRRNWFTEHSTSRPLWVARTENDIIAWVSFQAFHYRPAYRYTAEISIYIDERYRNQGIGRKLLIYSLDRCRELEISCLLAFIFAQNEPSIKLFKSLGFAEWAYLPNVAEIDGSKISLKILGKAIM